MPLKKMIIDAAEIPTRQGIYYLGPFARRVSFTSQQVRALNLVWALYEDGRIRSNDRVAVVGAGIAGVTAACALRAYGCTVDVFDRAVTPMWRQSAATHRTVHPTINFWPGSNELLPTTSQPFLEWHYERCSDVIDILMQQWNEFVAHGADLLKFHGQHDVRAAWQGHGQVFLEVQPRIRSSYRTAIIATGFGNELTQAEFVTIDYWKADNLELDRLGGQIANFIVSGCGDGGMIDALRVAYDFKHGRLAVEVAATLVGTEIETLLALYDTPGQARGDEYASLVRMIKEDARYENTRKLLESRIDDRTGLIVLVDKNLSNPFTSGAAPIHKLMVAYAQSRGVIRYGHGPLGRESDNSISTPVSSHTDHESGS